MKITRLEAVKQVKSMVNLVEDLAQTTLSRMVAGEELSTKSPLGVSMRFAKYELSMAQHITYPYHLLM